VSEKRLFASSGQCPRPVPNSRVRRWQRRGAKPRVTPKGRMSHPHAPGQGKTGRVSVSESSMRSRHSRMPESMANQDGMLESVRGGLPLHVEPQRSGVRCGGTPWLRDKEDTLPRRISPMRNVETPLWSAPGADNPSDRRSQPSARTAQTRSGTGRPNKRMPPVERHGESITRRIGPRTWSDPPRKGADVGLVNHRKTVAKNAHRGES